MHYDLSDTLSIKSTHFHVVLSHPEYNPKVTPPPPVGAWGAPKLTFVCGVVALRFNLGAGPGCCHASRLPCSLT